MFANLVTYHLHRHTLLAQDTPASAARVAPAYQYILAGNGVLVRAETRFFTALLLIAPGVVRGLPPLRPQFRLKVPRLPAGLLHTILTDARGATRPGGGLNEVLYHCCHHGRAVQLKKPPQQASATANAGQRCESLLLPGGPMPGLPPGRETANSTSLTRRK